MKEIKAFVRCEKAEEVVQALEGAGAVGINLIEVMAVGPNIDPSQYKYSIFCVEKYQKVAMLQTVCRAEDVDRLVGALRESAYTGMKGDGMIFVSDVEKVVKIRTGAENEAAL